MDVLADGGNAADAAVSAAFLLFVVEPHSCGVGGDAFVIAADGSRPPVGLDGAGAIPRALTEEQLAADGLDAVPARGSRSATVPGAVSLLETTLAAQGTWSLADAVAPAVAAARDGFEVRPTLAATAARAAAEIGADPVLGPLYVPGGVPVVEGQIVRNPALAECLTTIATEGAGALYTGALAGELATAIAADGGYLDATDLAAHTTVPAALESADVVGRTVWELPAPTQGPAVLEALRRLGGVLEVGRPVDWQAVLDAVHEGLRVAGFDPGGVRVSARPEGQGDTTHLAVADDVGLTVSLITSVFGDFGSHLGVPALGGPIHNRATTLRMVRQPPRPGKPPHTTIPAMVTDGDDVVCALGVAGGLMQPQAQVQLLARMLVEGLDPQAAIDAPRFKILFGGDVAVEPGHPLAERIRGAAERAAGPEGFGAAQVVGRLGGNLRAGADPRRGGAARVQ